MSYQLEFKKAPKSGYHTPDEARAYYGRYARSGITVHWWDLPTKRKDSDHDKIVNYIYNKAVNGIGSINYVSSNTKITYMVSPDNVAWHAFSGNPTTIGIEFSPHLNAEGYKKAGWLIWQLEQRYGRKLALYPHNHWSSTQCPGHLSLTRMRQEADKWAAGGYNPKPAPTPTPTPAPTPTPKIQYAALNKATWLTNKQPTKLWDLNANKWADFKTVKEYPLNHPVEVVGRAIHPLGGTYYMTAYSFGNGDPTKSDFKPAHAWGFNKKDLTEVKNTPTPEPQPTPEPVPEPEPTPEPTPEPQPEPTEYDKQQDKEIKLIKGTLNSLKALFIEFYEKFLTIFNKEL